MTIYTSRYDDRDRILPAFGIALGLHVLMMLVLPHLNQTPIKIPERFEIDLTQTQVGPPPAPEVIKQEQPQPEPPKPVQTPVKQQPVLPKASSESKQQALPVLTARSDTPPAQNEPVVAETPAVAPSNPVVPTAPVSTPAESSQSEVTAVASNSASPNNKNEEADPSEAWDGYGQQLYDVIAKNKNYPPSAIRRHLEGLVKLKARFSMGKLIEVTMVDNGSGYQVLDNAALETLKKAINAMPVKGPLLKKNFTVIVPVNFKLDD